MKWVKDPKSEHFMRSLGLKFEVETVPFPQIDREEGIKRQARLLGKLNQDHVLGMAVEMTKPDAAFPMCILQKPPRGLYWPWSGNHRLDAFDNAFDNAKDQSIEAYVMCIKDPIMLDVFPRVINTLESQIGFSREEKVANARYLCEKHGMSTQEAANLFGLKPEWISRAARAYAAKIKIEEMGVSTNGMAETTLNHLHKIAGNANVLKATAAFLTKHKIKGSEAANVVSDVESAPTELQAQRELGRWEQIIDERNRPLAVKRKVLVDRPMRSRFLSCLCGMAKILAKAQTLEQLQCIEPSDQQLIKRQWLNILKAMDMIVDK